MSDLQQPGMLVVAALIQHEQRYLVAERPAGKTMAGYWEFPGGKLHPNEEPREGLKREIFEELGVLVEVGDIIEVIQHIDPDKTVLLLFFDCRLKDGQPSGREGQRIRWVSPQDMLDMKFLPADIALITRLMGNLSPGSSIDAGFDSMQPEIFVKNRE
ncbi:(deoxy)nucleoside triphosphate pyrophosphohydrolase [bacterium]|nr:(deoxy)nucleoside triphosphate pyrophosphohydrolase [bacterium]MBV6482605.1 hypothetical protein [bacterium]MCE7908057.1 (deoxy)nucleoside triphosphate pyrophosphohydrolase [Candidatus Omnitrophica bacterium COP1]MCK6497613.1 (deoxy)nucleoside triphosphate pyrophosphohydrolase [bacterium]